MKKLTKIHMKLKYTRALTMAVTGIVSILLFALAIAQAVSATTVGTNVSTDGTLTVNGATTLGDSASADSLTVQGTITGTIKDNVTDSIDLQQGTNDYINVGTLDNAETLSFGNATTNPSFSFAGSGSITMTGSTIHRAATDLTTASNEALTLTANGTGDITLLGDADTDVIFSGLTNDIITTGNEALTVTAAGTGDVVLSTDADTNIQVTASAAPGVDMIAVTNTGVGATAANIDGLQIDLATATGAGANNSAIHANLLNAPVDASDVINGLEVTSIAQTVASSTLNLAFLDPAASGNTAGTLNALNIDALTANSATETAINIGSGWDTEINFGDTATVMSVANTGSITINDGTAGNNLLVLADAGAITIGSAADATTAVSIITDGTGDSELTVPNESISAAEILNVTRSVNLPIGAWFAALSTDTNSVRVLDTDETGNTDEPNLGGASAGNEKLHIVYDNDGTVDDSTYIITSFRVPQDYASGGAYNFVVSLGSATASQTEALEVATYRQTTGSAADTTPTTATTNIANSTNIQYITVTPAETYAAGDAINVRARQNNASADDATNIFGVDFTYTATQ